MAVAGCRPASSIAQGKVRGTSTATLGKGGYVYWPAVRYEPAPKHCTSPPRKRDIIADAKKVVAMKNALIKKIISIFAV